ncbi:MAG: C-terminal binding protein [Actinobacteria bacterium]|nr:C-terminal binding protein [Actinomycetota bacterium]
MNRLKIVFTDYDYPDIDIEKDILEELDCEIVVLQTKDEQKIISECSDADALIVQYAPITKNVIDNLQKCKVISRYGIGIDMVDLNAATQRGISVCNVLEYCLDEVADHTLALILALGRKIINLNDSVKKGTWDALRIAKPVYSFEESILGLVGFGKIPQNLFPKVLPVFKEIVIYDPYISRELIDKFNLKMISFYQMLHQSDYISIHCPLTKETHHLFSQVEFMMMKPTSFIINTSRGPMIDSADLYFALKSGQIAGAGLDVLEEEPPGIDNELIKLDNVIVTPHAAFYSETSIVELKKQTALNVLTIFKGDIPRNVVNKEVLEKRNKIFSDTNKDLKSINLVIRKEG